MEFFCYHRDRPGSTPLRGRMVEAHWAYMDRFATTMIARGPTFTSDGTLTGSVHILDLPNPVAARAFAFEEPGYQAGAYRDVLLRRWHNSLGRTMWDFSGGDETSRYLVLGFTEPSTDAVDAPLGDALIASGPLLSDDGRVVLGTAVLLEAPHADGARDVLAADRYVGVEVHQWQSGGRLGTGDGVNDAPALLRRSRPPVEGRGPVGLVVGLPAGVVGAGHLDEPAKPYGPVPGWRMSTLGMWEPEYKAMPTTD